LTGYHPLSEGMQARAQQVTRWLLARAQTSAKLTMDSRSVRKGDVFIAVPGSQHDGREYVAQALQAGASAVLAQADPTCAAIEHADVLWEQDLAALLGHVAGAFYGAPSQHLHTIAITGTNGKTSVSQWLAQALTRSGEPTGVIGTLGAGPVDALEAFGMTTPDSPKFHGLLADFVSKGLRSAVFEASSIGIEEHRLDGVAVDTAVFTNLTQDHLDYHGTMEAYGQAKLKLFAWPGLQYAVINLDDEWAGHVQAACSPEVAIIAYTLNASQAKAASGRVVLAEKIADEQANQTIELSVWRNGLQEELHPLTLHLVGQFNISNALAVAGALMAQGKTVAQAAHALSGLRPVSGRMQAVPLPGDAPLVVVDYAHTPDALQKTLVALRPTSLARAGRLIAVFGAGGDRDSAKRAMMGRVASHHADLVIVTSDNPRSEKPEQIAAQILAGMGRERANATMILDRAAALAHALRVARPSDVILVAGKGHEDYQEIAGVRYPFNDAAVIAANWGAHE
jgi:UDP-N-acetylmuramyl-tripeptide synthetase